MYRMTCDGLPLLDARDETLILTAPKVNLAENSVGGCSFKIYNNHPYYDRLVMLKSMFEVSDEFGAIFRGRMTENTRDIKRGKAVDLEGAMAFFNDSIVRPYTFPDDWEKENHPSHASYINAAESGNVVEYFLAWLIAQHNEQVAEFQRLKLGTVTVRDPNNRIERASSDYPNTWEEIRSKLFESSLGGKLCIRYEADGNYIDYLSEYTETNEQGITYGKNLRDFSQKDDGSETYSAIIPRGAESTNSAETGDSYEGMYGTITGATTTKKRLTIEELPDGNINDDIVKMGDVLYSKKAVAAFGWRFVPADSSLWEDVTEAENLRTKGVEVLEGKVTNIPSRIEVKAVDLHCTDKQIRSFRMYKKIPVHILPHGIDSDFDITSLDIDLLNPQNTDLAAGKTVMTFTDLQDKYTNELKSILGSLATTKQLAQGFKVTETLIEKTEESILLKASELYVTTDELGNYATTEELQSEIAVAVGSIDLSVYAKTTDLDSLSEEVAQIKIAQNGIDLSVYAKQTDVDSLSEEFGQIKIAQDSIVSTVSQIYSELDGYALKTDLDVYAQLTDLQEYAKSSDLVGFASYSQMYTAIDEAVDSITSTVAETYATIDTLNGYATLEKLSTEIKQTKDSINMSVSSTYATKGSVVNPNLVKGTGTSIAINGYKRFELTTAPLLTEQIYTFSADVDNGSQNQIQITLCSTAGVQSATAMLPIVNGHVSGTIKPTTVASADELRIFSSVTLSKIKLEKGDVETEWSLAPEDFATKAELALEIVEEDGKKVSKLSAYADKMSFNAGEIEIISDNFTLNSDGTMTTIYEESSITKRKTTLDKKGVTVDSTIPNDPNAWVTFGSVTWYEIVRAVNWVKENGDMV